MSVLTDLIYGGSNAVAGLTENAVNNAIAKYGADKEIAFPDTAYFFPTIYAATGVKVKTLGDLPACVGVLKSLITNQEDLGQALNAGLATAVGADAVLVNTAIAIASDPVAMARAFKLAVEAGRMAHLAGLGAQSSFAVASSPLTSFLD